jgi:hypothetical protein
MHDEIGIVCFMSPERLARIAAYEQMLRVWQSGLYEKGWFVGLAKGTRFELLDDDKGSHDEEAPATSLLEIARHRTAVALGTVSRRAVQRREFTQARAKWNPLADCHVHHLNDVLPLQYPLPYAGGAPPCCG